MTAPPTPPSIPVEIGSGLVGSVGAALYLLIHAPQVPMFVLALVVGFGGSKDFGPMLTALVAVALGVAMVVHGRRRSRAHAAFVARVEAMHKRRDARAGGTSAGVARSQAAPLRFPQAQFADDLYDVR